MNICKKIILTCIGLAVFSTSVAQEKKIYRWVDKSGKVHISDQLPPEANDQARTEYSAKTGTLKNSVQPQLSAQAQELARQQAEAKAYALEKAEIAKRMERGMLSNYATEEDLQNAFNERTDLIKQTIISLKASIQSRRAIVLSTLNELSSYELEGKPLPAEKIAEVKKNHELMLKQTDKLLQLNLSYLAIQNEFEGILVKYRQSKSGQSSPAQAESSATKAAEPKQNQ